MRFSALLGLWLLSATAFACDFKNSVRVEYTGPKRGEVTVYVMPLDPTQDDALCAFGSEFYSKATSFPNKGTVAVVNTEHITGVIIHWQLDSDIFTVVHLNPGGKGFLLQYPRPLERMTEILMGRPFPQHKELPAEYRDKFKLLSVQVSAENLKQILKKEPPRGGSRRYSGQSN